MSSFGDFLKALRLDNTELSLRQAAKEIEISATYLSRLENDRESPPSSDILLRIAKVYNIDENRLFDITQRLPPSIDEAINKNEVYKRKIPELMRTVLKRDLSEKEWDQLIDNAKK